MRVQLIDVDSTIPNLPLMQIAAWHNARGDWTGFDVPDPERVYLSCVFSRNAPRARGIAKLYPDADVRLGGSGVSLTTWLPPEMQKVKPDYDLYPSEYSMGFSTRGCIRRCPFCIVPAKEGGIQRWQHPSEFHDDRFDVCMLLDNNLLAADYAWVWSVTGWFIDHDVALWDSQGWDIRLMTPAVASRLREIRLARKKTLHFAFDNVRDEAAVRRGVAMLAEAGFDLRHEVAFYVLVGFDTTEAEDLHRCNVLKELGTNAFVMPYRRTEWTRRLARWANRRWHFWSTDFGDFAPERRETQPKPEPVMSQDITQGASSP